MSRKRAQRCKAPSNLLRHEGPKTLVEWRHAGHGVVAIAGPSELPLQSCASTEPAGSKGCRQRDKEGGKYWVAEKGGVLDKCGGGGEF